MTLFEAMTTLVIAGLLTSMVVTGAGHQADRAHVTLAQAAILDAYRIGRSAAQSLNRPVEVLVSEDSIVVREPGQPERVPISRRVGPRASAVTATPREHHVIYGPNGLPVGVANVTFRLQRGAIRRTVVVSRLGRLRVE